MIHCSGFAVFLGEGAMERLRKSLPRVHRHRKTVITSDGGDLWGPRPRESEVAVGALALGGKGMPLIHGAMLDEGEGPRGEFSYLAAREEGNGGTLVAGRDLLGTRPLYVSRDGKSLASDHRFFASDRDGRILLSPGSTYRTSDGSIETRVPPSAPSPDSIASAASELAGLIESSVRRRVQGERRVAVSFSGGLDSSIVAHCAARYCDVVLCSAYSVGSRDERQARLIAEKLGLPGASGVLTPDEVARELRVMDLPFEPTSMDEALWCIYSTTSRIARENGAETILLGQLADELFGGYLKYARAMEEGGAGAARTRMDEDLDRCGAEGLVRDEQACSRYVEPRFPFADEDVVAFARGLPVDFKIRDGRRKFVLREAAKVLGLPAEAVESPKKAAQYSSGILKLLP